jgi:hypothetical protein
MKGREEARQRLSLLSWPRGGGLYLVMEVKNIIYILFIVFIRMISV